MRDSVEGVVIGGGVIGLAVARALARAGRKVMLLEQERWLGTHTSSRNSEIIHAGLYYPAGSLKATLCVAGNKRLYAYCAERGVRAERTGKLVAAVNDDEARLLAGLMEKAKANGVMDLQLLDGAEARRLEPELACVAAFHSPSTGIVDSHGLMQSYEGEAEAAGATIVKRAQVLRGDARAGRFSLEVGGDETMTLDCEILVNAAGLFAPALARRIAGIPPAGIPRDYYCRGVYFTLAGKAPFRRQVYPVPEHAGLGIHYTRDLGGGAKFGPDTEWITGIDYTVDPRRGEQFYAAIRSYWPGLKDGALQPGYAGVRPKISGPTEPAADFMIAGPETHGIAGLVNLFGIESPGLTCSLEIAELVEALLNRPGAAARPAPRVPARPAPRS